MDSPACTTFAGIGLAVFIAVSRLGGFFIRKPVNGLLNRLKPAGHEKMPEEWCLYCVGFAVGVGFSLCGISWVENPVLNSFYMLGVSWLASEFRSLVEAVWFGFMERPTEEGNP